VIAVHAQGGGLLPWVAVARLHVLPHRRNLGPFPKTVAQHTATSSSCKEISNSRPRQGEPKFFKAENFSSLPRLLL